MAELDIGGRLRQVREEAGLSQRELARRAGITNSTVSLIEANRMNPSIGALKRILDAIPMPLAQFFALQDDAARPVFFRARELIEIGKGGISYKQIGPKVAGTKLQMLSECYQPGADTGRVPLRHEGEECGIILAGRIEVTVDGERAVLGPGDAYSFASDRPHRFRAIGPEEARVISACTPPSF